MFQSILLTVSFMTCTLEIELDPNRTFCPEAGCEAICHVCSTSTGERYNPTQVDCPEVLYI